mmetsp:Transcript_18209/g.23471  ORF Transcript_18209/g.23471 Transcript_18209/m.23471 type:complete len:234 (+) Transcript_18209:149-850(+)|eukprot:CAMPEP_0198144280 /NCGR_PEP_ID=MMETSP1443-20131203/14350_1 /TAXON_ID=186043 /ORGANISM="Entomoneis sp., Strain CCMP2396" /LENGTH=233 /DNA_ID=CAMNT_0043807643 /DNA_START=32 /DNA_END=733 /DNA_ORIENTATION=+
MNHEIGLGISPTSVADSPLRLLLHKDKGNNQESLTINQFVEQLPHIISTQKKLGIQPGSTEDRLFQMIECVDITMDELKQYAHVDPSRNYTRNLISTDYQSYTLLLLCWNPHKESPVHDHPCDGCWMRVVQGQIRECRYQPQHQLNGNDSSNSGCSSSLECTHEETFVQGQVTFIKDSMGYHKVGNASPGSEMSITLHLYSPPFQECRTWLDPKKKNACKSKMCLFSKFGHVI